MMEPGAIVDTMMDNDWFSQWLGITLIEKAVGRSRLAMTIRKEMLNGFGIAHGGITYSLADSALAFASNAQGKKSVSIETSISHVKSIKENDEIEALAICETETNKVGHYKVTVYRKNNPEEIVALFKGIVYKTSQMW